MEVRLPATGIKELEEVVPGRRERGRCVGQILIVILSLNPGWKHRQAGRNARQVSLFLFFNFINKINYVI